MNLAQALQARKLTLLEDMRQARRELILTVASDIIDGTPVKTGALRGSWQSSIEAPILDAVPRLDPSGATPKAQMASLPISLGNDIYFANSLPYAERIEYGYSQQAPAGMVRVNIAGRENISFNLET